MVEENGANDGAEETVTSLLSGPDSGKISTLILLCLRDLYEANLQPVDFTTVDVRSEDQGVFLQVVDFLRHQQFTAGPPNSTLLSIKGYKSLRTVASKDGRVAKFLVVGEMALNDSDPVELVMTILRAHFEEWQKQ